MTRGDRIVVVVLAVVALIAVPVVGALARGGDMVVVNGPAGRTVVPLSTDGTLNVKGIDGELTVRVDDGEVRVISSSCPDQVCVRSGAVDSHGGVIACVPNGVTIVVGDGEESGLDAVVH